MENLLNIGNLILLEEKLNGEAGNLNYSDKKEIFQKSSYSWINLFVNKNETWSAEDIETRAEQLAQTYYKEILKRNT